MAESNFKEIHKTVTNIKSVGELTNWKEILTDASGTKTSVKLDDVLKSKLLTLTFNHSLFYKIVNPNKLKTEETSTTFLKNPGTVAKAKGNVLGAGVFDTWRFGSKETIKFTEPFVQTAGIPAVDLTYDIRPAVVDKMTKMVERMKYDHEKYGFNKVETSIKEAMEVNFKKWELEKNKKTDTEIYKKLRKLLINLATKITQTQDMAQGINFLDKNNIVIFVKDEILDDIAEVGLLGDRVTETFAQGASSVYKIGGYTIYPNKYLEKYDAIVTTDFVAGGDIKLIASNFSTLEPSNDLGVYMEYQYAAGMIYNDLTYGIKIIETEPSTDSVSSS